MRIRPILVPLGLAFTLMSCSQRTKPVSEAEMGVINVLLQAEFEEPLSEGRTLVILDSSSLSGTMVTRYESFSAKLLAAAKHHDEGLVEAVEDFLGKNASRWDLSSVSQLSVRHQFLSGTELHELGRGSETDYWEAFYKKFDSPGHVTLSRVGLNSAGDVAVVYMANQWDYLGGEGRLYVYRKSGSKWHADSVKLPGGYVS